VGSVYKLYGTPSRKKKWRGGNSSAVCVLYKDIQKSFNNTQEISLCINISLTFQFEMKMNEKMFCHPF
jgi:hypothetical protein